MANSADPKVTLLSKLPQMAKRFDTLKSKSDDARSGLGDFYSAAESDGFNRAALKLALKLRGMEPEKRTVFLTDLNEYARKLGVFADPSLFEDPQTIGATGPDPEDGDGAGETGDEDETETGDEDASVGDPVSDEPPASAEKTPQQIEAYNLGEAEGKAGGRAEANPYTDDDLHKSYHLGWENGQAAAVHAQMGTRSRSRRSQPSLQDAEPAGVA